MTKAEKVRKEIWTSAGWGAWQQGTNVYVVAPDGRKYLVRGWIDQGRIYVPDGEVTVFGGPRYIVEICGLGKRIE